MTTKMKAKILFLITTLPFGAMAQQEYTIIGKLKNIQYPAKAYLLYSTQNGMRKDSAVVVNDQFVMKGNSPELTKAFVFLRQKGAGENSAPSPDQVGIFLETGTITINSPDSLGHARIGGTKTNLDQQEMTDIMTPLMNENIRISAAYEKAEGNEELKKKIWQEHLDLEEKAEKTKIDFIKNHSNSIVSLNMVRLTFNPATDPEKARIAMGMLSKELQQSKNGQRYMQLFNQAPVNIVKVGSQAPEFSMNNTEGKPVSLSSYKGKYVLLDFWASWCMPCRKENPNVVKAYNTFKDKNFTVVGISLDAENAKDKWLAAIKADGLPYDQLSDLKSQNTAAGLYQVSEIPTNFLIDPSGKIIAKNLRGAQLSEKLAEVLLKSK